MDFMKHSCIELHKASGFFMENPEDLPKEAPLERFPGKHCREALQSTFYWAFWKLTGAYLSTARGTYQGNTLEGLCEALLNDVLWNPPGASWSISRGPAQAPYKNFIMHS